MTCVALYTEQKRLIVWADDEEPGDFDAPVEADETVRQVVPASDGQLVLLVAQKRVQAIDASHGVVMNQYPPKPRPAYMTTDPLSYTAAAYQGGWIIGGAASASAVNDDLSSGTFTCPVTGGCYAVHVAGDDVWVGGGKGSLHRMNASGHATYNAIETTQPLVLLASHGDHVSGVLASNEIITWNKRSEPMVLGPLAEVLAIAVDAKATYLLCGNGKLVRADGKRFELVHEWAAPFACATTLGQDFIAADDEGHLVRLSADNPGEVMGLVPIDAGRALLMGAT